MTAALFDLSQTRLFLSSGIDLKEHSSDSESSLKTGCDSAAGVWREGSDIWQGGLTDLESVHLK